MINARAHSDDLYECTVHLLQQIYTCSEFTLSLCWSIARSSQRLLMLAGTRFSGIAPAFLLPCILGEATLLSVWPKQLCCYVPSLTIVLELRPS